MYWADIGTQVGPHSGKKQHVRSKGRKFERARGARKSRGFKIT